MAHDDIIVVMEKKKISPKELAQTLERIEGDTWYEAKERERLGLTQEPKGAHVPIGQEAGYLRAKKRERGKSTPGFIEEWQEENRDYVLRNDDVSEARINNETDVKFPVEFVDYLINNARKTLDKRGLNTLGEIQTIRIKYILENHNVIIVAVRDKADNITILDFHSVPPFDLKQVNSTMGVNTF